MPKHAVIINGAAEVGKDKFVELCKEPAERLGFKICNFSSVDGLKRELFTEEEPYNKSPEHRQRLVDAKARLMLEDPTYFARHMAGQIEDAPETSISFLHVREPEQIVVTLGHLGLNMPEVNLHTLLIIRHGLFIPENTADTRVEEYDDYEDTIVNDSDLADLAKEAEEYVSRLVYAPS